MPTIDQRVINRFMDIKAAGNDQKKIFKALSEKMKSKAELGRHFGVSRVRVVQILNLLKLDPGVINKLKEVGETLNKKVWGEKTLRTLVCLTPDKQMEKISLIKL